jgi:glutathione synthase
MRKDPPFDMEYIYSTYILDRAEQTGSLVVNRPQGLRDMNEKVYTAWFPECCAPTLITRNMADMHAFQREHGKIVCKPLYGMGGRSVFVIESSDKNAQVISETLTDYGSQFAIVQRYLPEIVERRRLPRHLGGRRAGPLRARSHPLVQRQPRQSCCRGYWRRPAPE